MESTLAGDHTDHLHLQWFADGDPGTTGGTTDPKAGDQTGEANAAQNGTVTISKAELSQIKQSLKKATDDNAHLLGVHQEMKDKSEKRKEAEAAKRGEFETLYTNTKGELETLTPKMARYEGVIKVMLDAELAALPEGFDLELIPAGDPDQQLDWIAKAKASGFLKKEVEEVGKGDGSPSATSDSKTYDRYPKMHSA